MSSRPRITAEARARIATTPAGERVEVFELRPVKFVSGTTLLTSERLSEAEVLLADGCSLSTVALNIGVSSATMRRWFAYAATAEESSEAKDAEEQDDDYGIGFACEREPAPAAEPNAELLAASLRLRAARGRYLVEVTQRVNKSTSPQWLRAQLDLLARVDRDGYRRPPRDERDPAEELSEEYA